MTDITDMKNVDMNIKDDEILYIYTKKIPAFKALIEALKEIFTNINIKFTPKVEKQIDDDPTNIKVTGGMYITAMNSNNSIFVRLYLEADKFGYYECKCDDDKKYLLLGVNMSNLFKLIKFLGNDDELIMIYNKTSLNQLNLRYVNKQKQLKTNYYLKLLDIREERIEVGKQTFDFVISMPSVDFHNLIKNMSVIAEDVDIKFVSDNNSFSLIFSCKGEFAEQESIFKVSSEGNAENNIINVARNEDDVVKQDGTSIIQGIYKLESLSLFSRCTSMCPIIELYIKNDCPLIIKYRVADMGSVHLILSSINKDDQLNNDDDDEDDSYKENENEEEANNDEI
jgi:proliferating cell nuclear antigen PCNA